MAGINGVSSLRAIPEDRHVQTPHLLGSVIAVLGINRLELARKVPHFYISYRLNQGRYHSAAKTVITITFFLTNTDLLPQVTTSLVAL